MTTFMDGGETCLNSDLFRRESLKKEHEPKIKGNFPGERDYNMECLIDFFLFCGSSTL